jgi:hypothetical protein
MPSSSAAIIGRMVVCPAPISTTPAWSSTSPSGPRDHVRLRREGRVAPALDAVGRDADPAADAPAAAGVADLVSPRPVERVGDGGQAAVEMLGRIRQARGRGVEALEALRVVRHAESEGIQAEARREIVHRALHGERRDGVEHTALGPVGPVLV